MFHHMKISTIRTLIKAKGVNNHINLNESTIIDDVDLPFCFLVAFLFPGPCALSVLTMFGGAEAKWVALLFSAETDTRHVRLAGSGVWCWALLGGGCHVDHVNIGGVVGARFPGHQSTDSY